MTLHRRPPPPNYPHIIFATFTRMAGLQSIQSVWRAARRDPAARQRVSGRAHPAASAGRQFRRRRRYQLLRFGGSLRRRRRRPFRSGANRMATQWGAADVRRWRRRWFQQRRSRGRTQVSTEYIACSIERETRGSNKSIEFETVVTRCFATICLALLCS